MICMEEGPRFSHPNVGVRFGRLTSRESHISQPKFLAMNQGMGVAGLAWVRVYLRDQYTMKSGRDDEYEYVVL